MKGLSMLPKNLPSATNTAGFESSPEGTQTQLKNLQTSFEDFAGRTQKAFVSMTEALNILVRLLQAINFPAYGSGTLVAGAASQVVLRQNSDRKFAVIVNSEAATDVYINLGAVAISGTGITLKPGGTFSFGTNTDMKWTGEVSAITAGASAVLTFVEA